jgi:hypothetical protein
MHRFDSSTDLSVQSLQISEIPDAGTFGFLQSIEDITTRAHLHNHHVVLLYSKVTFFPFSQDDISLMTFELAQ